jgi:glutaconate CoA-transferase, subunit A
MTAAGSACAFSHTRGKAAPRRVGTFRFFPLLADVQTEYLEAMARITRSLDEALAPITDGCMLAVPRETSGVAMAATRALIRRGVQRLHLVALPTSTLQTDLLIGAGAIATLETSAVSLGEFGPAPRFNAAILAGAIDMRDATCPALHAQFQAAEKGVPFMPLRGLIGSDLMAHRPDWKVIDNPFGDNDPIVLLPALKPDVALFHAPLADRDGNVYIGRERELVIMAHAAARTIVTVEEIHFTGLLCRSGRSRAARCLAAAVAGSLRHRCHAYERIRAARSDAGRFCAISRPLCLREARGLTRPAGHDRIPRRGIAR